MLRGEYIDVGKSTLDEVAQAIARRRKDAVIRIRVNSQDLKQIKGKAKKLGVGYQTLISEMLHRVAVVASPTSLSYKLAAMVGWAANTAFRNQLKPFQSAQGEPTYERKPDREALSQDT